MFSLVRVCYQDYLHNDEIQSLSSNSSLKQLPLHIMNSDAKYILIFNLNTKVLSSVEWAGYARIRRWKNSVPFTAFKIQTFSKNSIKTIIVMNDKHRFRIEINIQL